MWLLKEMHHVAVLRYITNPKGKKSKPPLKTPFSYDIHVVVSNNNYSNASKLKACLKESACNEFNLC